MSFMNCEINSYKLLLIKKFIHFWIHFNLNHFERKTTMIKPFKFPKALLTGSALLALTSFQGLAFANDARIQMDGEITGATCLLAGSQDGTGTDQSATNMSLNLGSGNLTKITTAPQAIGDVLEATTWAPKIIAFSLKATIPDTGVATPCTFVGTGTTGWDILATPDNSDLILSAPNGATFLKNNIAVNDGGTDAVVVLKGGKGDVASDAGLVLSPTGTYLTSGSGSPFSADADDKITMSAQLVSGKSGAKPIAGKYQSFINLLVKYN